MIQACQCQANPTPSRGWKPPCSPPRVRFCAVTTPPLMEDGESPGRNGCAEMTVRQHVAVRAKLVRTASTRFPRFGRAKSWQNASKCPQKPAGRRCAAWRPPCGRGPAMPRSADTSNLIVAFGSATVFTSTLTLGANPSKRCFSIFFRSRSDRPHRHPDSEYQGTVLPGGKSFLRQRE